MTTAHRDNDSGQDFPRVPIEAPVEALLAQAEHELTYRRSEFVAARTEARIQRRRARRDRRHALRKRAAHVAGATLPTAFALTGTVVFAAAAVLLLVGNFDAAKDLLALAVAAWGGATAFRRPPQA
ncbi:hypothetical protein [Streptomyces thinghirensis]|uniref:DUF3040 domain-containing protein n=1 Tax=Streptomyces thinghirensis TaxID=551547 RepID=A0ABP9THJ8_9ACTN